MCLVVVNFGFGYDCSGGRNELLIMICIFLEEYICFVGWSHYLIQYYDFTGKSASILMRCMIS
jgi:hypothetical protein